MKKVVAIILMCILFGSTVVCAEMTGQETEIRSGFGIVFNGAETGYTSVIYNDQHFLPMRKIFELMEGVVFYRARDSKILILTRDGDSITHVIGETTISVNGEEKTFENPSIRDNGETYISVEMTAAAICPDRIFYYDGGLYIEKQIVTNEYHKVIKEVLAFAKTEDFNPEKFESYKKYYSQTPGCTVLNAVFMVNLGMDRPFYENITTIEQPYELLVLVNKYNQLPSQFQQYNLINMDEKYTLRDGKEYLLAGVAYNNYLQMWDAAEKEGLSMIVVSAYRTEDYQRNLYNKSERTSGQSYADRYSARAGHSEHQTGLAMDIGSTLTSFENSDEFRWLQNHAHEYGYILRYPKDKEWITGYAYEPWHYRFVGTDVAKTIYEEGITFEEYYAKYICVNEFR